MKEAFAKVADAPEAVQSVSHGSVSDLPLVEVPAKDMSGDTLAVIVSGDGGWANIDRELGAVLAVRGIPVVGLNSLQYFWTRRTPEGTASDLERVLRYYLISWSKNKALLIGYSRGADVLPFMANRLPDDLRTRVQAVALLGPSQMVGFEFHLTDWLTNATRTTARPILPEVEKLKGMKILCLYGSTETDSLCKNLDATLAKGIPLTGGHHFDGNYEAIADTILREANTTNR